MFKTSANITCNLIYPSPHPSSRQVGHEQIGTLGEIRTHFRQLRTLWLILERGLGTRSRIRTGDLLSENQGPWASWRYVHIGSSARGRTEMLFRALVPKTSVSAISTTEPYFGAFWSNRTAVGSLQNYCSAIELRRRILVRAAGNDPTTPHWQRGIMPFN